MTAALLKPASRSPYDHSSGALPIGRPPSGAAAKSCSVHFSVCSFGRGGGPPAPGAAGGAGYQTLPSVRPLAPPGRRLSIGSTTNGSGSRSHVDPLDRFGRGQLVDRGDGENRLALIERLVGERALGAAKVRQIVGPENRLHAGHRQRGARVDADHARVRHRAEQQLGEQHPVGAIVLGVLRAAGDLRDQIGRRVVLADELLVRHGLPPTWCARLCSLRGLAIHSFSQASICAFSFARDRGASRRDRFAPPGRADVEQHLWPPSSRTFQDPLAPTAAGGWQTRRAKTAFVRSAGDSAQQRKQIDPLEPWRRSCPRRRPRDRRAQIHRDRHLPRPSAVGSTPGQRRIAGTRTPPSQTCPCGGRAARSATATRRRCR